MPSKSKPLVRLRGTSDLLQDEPIVALTATLRLAAIGGFLSLLVVAEPTAEVMIWLMPWVKDAVFWMSISMPPRALITSRYSLVTFSSAFSLTPTGGTMPATKALPMPPGRALK